MGIISAIIPGLAFPKAQAGLNAATLNCRGAEHIRRTLRLSREFGRHPRGHLWSPCHLHLPVCRCRASVRPHDFLRSCGWLWSPVCAPCPWEAEACTIPTRRRPAPRSATRDPATWRPGDSCQSSSGAAGKLGANGCGSGEGREDACTNCTRHDRVPPLPAPPLRPL